MLSERILAQWWHPVDSCEALDLLHLAIHAILNHHIAMAIEIASNVVHVFFIVVLLIVILVAIGAIYSE